MDFVDITDINEEGLLYDDKDVDKIAEKFKKEGVDGLMLPHCNFGTEYVCARTCEKTGCAGSSVGAIGWKDRSQTV